MKQILLVLSLLLSSTALVKAMEADQSMIIVPKNEAIIADISKKFHSWNLQDELPIFLSQLPITADHVEKICIDHVIDSDGPSKVDMTIVTLKTNFMQGKDALIMLEAKLDDSKNFKINYFEPIPGSKPGVCSAYRTMRFAHEHKLHELQAQFNQ